ncbi:hypothetical protein Droror1_Dr00010997 [Drosera rotundifolia]
MMYEWGDDDDRSSLLPWLIWIQLLVLFLLILLISSFTFSAVDDRSDDATTTMAAYGIASFSSIEGVGNGYTVAAQRISSTSNKIAVADSNAERDGKLTCSFDLSRSFKDMFHPCRYFELAGRAFLGCLGLISFPWNPSPDDTEEDANN